jgi:ribosomal protein S18 acetylase RimI-like enzyme
MQTTADARILPLREEDISDLVQLARDIWHRHYPSIITVEQIEYMLAQRYHPDVIRGQLASGSAWWDKLMLDGAMIAFTSYELGKHPYEMKLDKLYVRYDLRGHGYGSLLIRHVESQARLHGCRRLSLQVNKHNTSAIAAYRRNGFEVVESAKFDIGNGFYMDDYVMAKGLAPEQNAEPRCA